MSQPATVEEIVATIQRLELVPLEQQAQLHALAQTGTDPLQFYRALVRENLLTPYQANALATQQLEKLQIGPYCILDRLGQGNISEVFKARHRALGRICTLKVMGLGALDSPELVQRFFREAQLATRLNHPNILAVYDAGQDGNRYYYAMEYVEGKSLAQLVRERGPLPIPLACEYVRQAALALQHAADLGLCHRNLKPSNLLVTRTASGQSNVIKILDFGMAPVVSELTGPTAKKAAPDPNAFDYLAPEACLQPHLADIRADIYSLGAILFFLLTGRSPVPDTDPQRKISAKSQGQLTPILELRKDLPATLVSVLEKALAARPEERFQTPGQLAQALAPWALISSAYADSGRVESQLADVPPALVLPTTPESQRWLRPTRRNVVYLLFGFLAMFALSAPLALFLVLRLVPSAAHFGSQPEQTTRSAPTQIADTTPSPADKANSKPQEEKPPSVPEISPDVASLVLQNPTPTGKILTIALDPQGQKVAILEEIGQVNIYTAAESKLLVSFPVATDRAPLALSWCGAHRLAVIYQDGIEWRDGQRGHILSEMRLPLSAPPKTKLSPQPVAFSHYLDLLAVPWNDSLVLINTDTHRYEVRKDIPTPVLGIASSHRAETCLLLSGEKLYQVDGQVRPLEIPKPEPTAQALPVGALSPDGSWAALAWKLGPGAKAEYSILAWSLVPPNKLLSIRTPAPPQQLVFIPASQQLAVLYGNSLVVIHDLLSGDMSLVIRGSGRIMKVAAASLAPRLVLCEGSALYASAWLREPTKPDEPRVQIVREPEDPPSQAAVLLPLPVVGQEREARARLRQKFADLYSQLPRSRTELIRQLLELCRFSQQADEVLACGLEVAYLSGPAADFNTLETTIKVLQDRLLAESEELSYLTLQEFTLAGVPDSAALELVNRWELLANTFASELDFTKAVRCLKQASAIAQRQPKLSATKVPQYERKIALYTRATEEQEQVKTAYLALQKNPDDVQAHKILGTFYLRYLEDYPRGLRHWLQCADALLVKIAQMELAPPKEIQEMTQLADLWVEAGKAEPVDTQARWYYERAVHWYRQAYSLQIQENAVLAALIAEHWQKAVARFPDLSRTNLAGFIAEQQTALKSLSALCVSGDKLLCVGRIGEVPFLLILDAETGKELSRQKLPALARWLADCGSSNLLAVGLTTGAFLWFNTSNLGGGPQEVSTEGIVYAKAVYSEKSNRLLALGDEYLFSFMPGWRAAVSAHKLTTRLGTGTPELAVAPKADRLVLAGRSPAGTPRLFLADFEGRILDTYAYTTKGAGTPVLAFSADGSIVAAGWQKEVTLFPLPLPGKDGKLMPESSVEAPSAITAILPHPHRGQFILGFDDGNVGFLNLEDRKITVHKGVTNHPVRSLAVYPKRNWAFVGYANGVVAVFYLPAK